MKPTERIVNWIPVAMAACSVASIVLLLQVDVLVHGTLYNYGLQFNNGWAIPYWNTIRIVFAILSFVAIASTGLQLYNVTRKKEKKTVDLDQKLAPEEKRWNTYRLGDGSTIRVKMVLKSAKRLSQYAPDGTPLYAVTTDNVVQVVEAPEELKARHRLLSAN